MSHFSSSSSSALFCSLPGIVNVVVVVHVDASFRPLSPLSLFLYRCVPSNLEVPLLPSSLFSRASTTITCPFLTSCRVSYPPCPWGIRGLRPSSSRCFLFSLRFSLLFPFLLLSFVSLGHPVSLPLLPSSPPVTVMFFLRFLFPLLSPTLFFLLLLDRCSSTWIFARRPGQVAASEVMIQDRLCSEKLLSEKNYVKKTVVMCLRLIGTIVSSHEDIFLRKLS